MCETNFLNRKNVIELAILAQLAFYLIIIASYTTTFGFVFPLKFETNLLLVLFLTVASRAILIPYNKKTIFALLIGIVFYLSWREVGYIFLFYVAVLMVGLAEIDYRKILKTYILSVGTITIGATLASLCGAITNLVYSSAARGIRSSWGIGFPTDFATGLLFLLIIAFCLFLNIPNMFFFMIGLGVLSISMFIARSITTSVCLIFFLVCIIAMDQLKWLDDGREVWSRNRKIARLIPIAAFPVCALFVFFLVYVGLTGHVSLLDFNEYTHLRMGLSIEAIKNYGIKPFGTAFDQIGAGGSTVSDIRYNFVDSTYVLILVRYGWVTFVAIMISWIYMAIKVVKSGNRRLALAMTIVAVHSISEHHFPEINYNIFLAMPFATFGTQVANKEISLIEWIGTGTQKRKKLIRVAVIFLEIIVTVVLMPFAFSWLRTAFHGHDYSGGGNREIKVLVILIGLCIAVLVLLNNLSRAVADYIVEKSFNRKNLIFSGLSFCVLAVVFFKTNIMIEQVGKWHFDEIADESYFVRLIEDSADGRFYVDTYPECYDRIIGGVSRSFINGEDLARFANTTVLVDSELDSSCFFSRGFLYFPISEKSAVYTNDKGVIKSLEENGYKLFGFYTGEKNVDMAFESSINSLPMTESGGLILDGMAHSLIYGPYIDMNNGKYLVSYNLKIDPVQYTDDYEVITLKVNTYWGENTIAQKAVYRSYFDEDGELLYELPFTTWGGKAVEFLAFTPDGQKVDIESIKYRKNPDYDTHFDIDKKGRVIHEEYFTLEGEPIALSNGCYGRDYEYDKEGNRILERFLGADNTPMLNTGGFAETHSEYNKNGLVTKIEYYDEKGAPIVLSGGQSAFNREYDREGNVLSESYYGPNGEKILLNGQYHEVKRRYDEEGRVVYEEYMGTDNKVTVLPNGYCAFSMEYDERGNLLYKIFYGCDGNPVITAWGYAGIKRIYNDDNKVIREEYLGTEGKPIALSGGQAAVERDVDKAGNIYSERYFGVNNEPILYNGNYFRVQRVFNSGNQNIHEEFFGTDDMRIQLSDGAYGYDRKYDASGNVIELIYLGNDMNEAMNTSGYSKVSYVYNSDNKLCKRIYYNLNNEVVAEEVIE